MQVEVIDGVDDFVDLMQELFNFDQIRDLLRSDFPLAFDAMHAVTGPYATRLFEGLLELHRRKRAQRHTAGRLRQRSSRPQPHLRPRPG